MNFNPHILCTEIPTAAEMNKSIYSQRSKGIHGSKHFIAVTEATKMVGDDSREGGVGGFAGLKTI